MTKDTPVTILYGGISNERAVSLISGKQVAEGLEPQCPVRLIDVTETGLPDGLDPLETVVFPVLHGEFGEDGQIQALLENAQFEFAGSGSLSSRLCMNKVDTKRLMDLARIRTPQSVSFFADNKPDPKAVVSFLGQDLVVKPADQGSSMNLHVLEGVDALAALLDEIQKGHWLIEERIHGRILTIGVLNGRALAPGQIIPEGGLDTYETKYTPGKEVFEFPAKVPSSLRKEMEHVAEELFHICDCRDFARVDFVANKDELGYCLEINTIPGLTPVSLLPQSAQAVGIDWGTLCYAMVGSALERFNTRRLSYVRS